MKLAWIAALIGLSAANGANAQTLEYDCDTQAEHFSVLKAVQQGPSYKASGSISPRAIFPSKTYATIGVIDFEPDDKSWRARLGLTALVIKKREVVMATLEITRAGKSEEPVMLGSIEDFRMGGTYPISVTLGDSGGTATIGSNTVPIKLAAQGNINVSIICSGGEFLFTNLNIGG
ncbi:hypothetical protein [Sphingomonas turrisvirgatae]|nr:hypothetical protein [Sphingomonas turrisvirgatae]